MSSQHEQKALRVYLVDVAGGQATLFVTPGRQSLLIDAGWPGYDGRDADRIVAAAKDAGIDKIDFVLITHFHKDHAGGITPLAAKIPLGTVVDQGEKREHSDADAFIANLPSLDSGNFLKLIAWKNGTFAVFNSRTHRTKHYDAVH